MDMRLRQAPSGSARDGAHFEMYAGLHLQRAYDAEYILGGRIAAKSEHPHQALGRPAEIMAFAAALELSPALPT